ncbi:MAG: GatB/YqeY domain-containing protein [Balneolaceae bacterium]
MSIKDQILIDLKKAMKAKDSEKLRVLRSIKSKLMEKEISERQGGERSAVSNEQAVEVLMKAAKQRRESIEQFEEGGREDLAEKEKVELDVIESYLPEMMDEEEIRKTVKEKIEVLGASTMADMGKVMGVLMEELKGKAEGSMVSRIVKEELSD